MADWKHRCNIKEFLNRDDLSNKQIFEKISEQLTKCRAFDDETFADELLEITGLDEDEMIREGDYLLDQIYDFADANRIWMGP